MPFSSRRSPTDWDETETQRWLSSAKNGLNGQTPLEALATDAGSKQVEELLYRAEYGIFG